MSVDTGIEHRYAPRGACKALFYERGAEVLISGPAGTGKSRACLEKLHMMALVNPKLRGAILRKTARSLAGAALVTWREYVIAEALRAGIVEYYGGSDSEPPQYRYPGNGSAIMIGGLDKPDKIMSTEYDVAYIQEATECTIDDWEKVASRLRNGRVRFQQLIGDCNPNVPWHFLKKRCETGAARMLESRHEDNPRLFDDGGELTEEGRAYIARLDALTGVRYLRLRKGLWVGAEGMVYEDWNPAVHVLPRFEIPASWPRYWVIDFGYTNPFVCQWWAEDPDGRLYLYRELYHSKRLVEDHARRILAAVGATSTMDTAGNVSVDRSGLREPWPQAIVCDHDAEGRATLQKHLGTVTTAARKEVEKGIQAFEARLRPAGDGRPRAFVLEGSLIERDAELDNENRPVDFVSEIVGYIWPPGVDGKPNKEEPVKDNDHSMDAARYMVAHKDLRSRAGYRTLA